MSKVVSLRGDPIASPGQPNQDVIAAAEKILELAQSGEIGGLTYALDFVDNSTGAAMVGDTSRGTVGRLFGLATEISMRLAKL
ncbi:MAG: hypothetical protein Q8R92_18370 [Deltaproteobacteria bacterium]|nr:hypothetical protein [Deltaproteobacteria bacterium]